MNELHLENQDFLGPHWIVNLHWSKSKNPFTLWFYSVKKQDLLRAKNLEKDLGMRRGGIHAITVGLWMMLLLVNPKVYYTLPLVLRQLTVQRILVGSHDDIWSPILTINSPYCRLWFHCLTPKSNIHSKKFQSTSRAPPPRSSIPPTGVLLCTVQKDWNEHLHIPILFPCAKQDPAKGQNLL